MDNINSDFRETIINTISLKDPLIDIGEALLDSEISNEILKGIPILGWFSKTVSVVDKVRTKFLVDKIFKFLNGLSDTSEDVFREFEAKYLSNPEDLEGFYSALLIAIDRIDHLDKMKILANLFSNLLIGKIDEPFFQRSFNIVQSLYFNDLKDFIENKMSFSYSEQYEIPNINQSLISLGLLTFHIVNVENYTKRLPNETELKFHYMYSSFGLKFINACKLNNSKRAL
jgi:hypothetical protein